MSSKIDVTGGSYNIGLSADRVGFTPPSETDLISTDVQDSLVEIYSKTLSRIDAINQQLAALNSNLTALTNRVADITTPQSYSKLDSTYGKFYFIMINGIKWLRIVDPKNLSPVAYTTLDFKLSTEFRPTIEVYETLYEPKSTGTEYAIRVNIKTDGTIMIYNYGSATRTLNMAGTFTYI